MKGHCEHVNCGVQCHVNLFNIGATNEDEL